MLYTESKEKSAELLRSALALMNQHDAPFNPVTYTVWYEHAAGLNARLSQAIERFRKDEPRLGKDTVERLYREHIAGVDEATMERISADFQRVMKDMADSAGRTGASAGAFDDELSQLSAALQSQDAQALAPQLAGALQHTQAMRHSAAELQAQVAASQQEIVRLRGDLDRAREEAFIDSLTRVLNRKGLDHRMERLLQEPLPAGDTHSLVMLDIDHFKRVNDGHGHLMGDRVIAAVGEVLRASISPGNHIAARYGGEEFAIVLPHTPLQAAAQLAESVRQRAKAMKLRNKTTNEVVLTITVSAGVASLRDGEDLQAWIGRADAALYQSKQTGRDRVSLAPTLN